MYALVREVFFHTWRERYITRTAHYTYVSLFLKKRSFRKVFDTNQFLKRSPNFRILTGALSQG